MIAGFGESVGEGSELRFGVGLGFFKEVEDHGEGCGGPASTSSDDDMFSLQLEVCQGWERLKTERGWQGRGGREKSCHGSDGGNGGEAACSRFTAVVVEVWLCCPLMPIHLDAFLSSASADIQVL